MRQKLRTVILFAWPLLAIPEFCYLRGSWEGLPIVARDYGPGLAHAMAGGLLAAPVVIGAVFGILMAASEIGGLLTGLAYGLFGSVLVLCDLYTAKPPVPMWLVTTEAAIVLAAFVIPGHLRSRGLLQQATGEVSEALRRL